MAACLAPTSRHCASAPRARVEPFRGGQPPAERQNLCVAFRQQLRHAPARGALALRAPQALERPAPVELAGVIEIGRRLGETARRRPASASAVPSARQAARSGSSSAPSSPPPQPSSHSRKPYRFTFP